MSVEHPLVRRLLEDQLGAAGVDGETHPHDRSLAYLERLYGHRDLALVSYFREGLSVQKLVRQVLQWALGARAPEARILDFASGFGRTTRFLVAEHPRRRVWVSDILPAALEFQERSFGVVALPSAPAPALLAVEPGLAFELVTAVSFFSHLPAAAFRGWLERLAGLLAPHGVLAFSVHGESVLLPGRVLGEDGFHFEEVSEIDELDPSQYGSAWASERFVAQVLRSIDPALSWHRFPRGLWSYQDLYLVWRGPRTPPPRLVLEPQGRIEELSPAAGREPQELAGWAADHDGSPVESVSLAVNGEVVACGAAPGARPDVAAHLGVASACAGWRLPVAAPGGRRLAPDDVLLVKARARSGSEFVLHAGTAEGTALWLRLQEAERRIRELEHEVRMRDLRIGKELRTRGALWWGLRARDAELRRLQQTLAASRFWKLRNAWWGWKGRFGR